MPPTAARVPLDTGLEYEVLSWAPADPTCDHTLLLLHGFLDLAWGWLPFVESGRFAALHVLAPSFRGHGRSDWVGAGGTYYFLDYVADLASLVASHARERLTIVGHSMGGAVAAYFAATYPDRAPRVALLEGLSAPEDLTRPARLADANRQRAEALARRGTPAAPGGRRFASLEDAARRMCSHDPQLDPAIARRLSEAGCVQLPSGEWVFRHDPLHATRSPVGFEVEIARRFWSEVRADLLYVEGEASPARLVEPERARRLGAFTGARSRTEASVAGAGHMMLRHRPVETADVVARWIADVSASG